MAEVFSNSMVAHVWAQQRQPYGRSNNGNFYFERETLYSYGTHFPVGIFAGPGGPVFLNSDSYSISTAKHKNDAWAAVRHIPERYSLPALASVRRLILSANARGKLPAEQRKPALAYLESQWAKLPEDSSGAAWLLRATGSRATWAAMRARFAAKADAAAAKAKAGLKAQHVKAGRELAARPWPEVKGDAWQAAASYGQRDLRETIADCRAARLATPKAHKRVRSILWTYEKRLRAILASAEADAHGYNRGNAGDRTKARAALAKLRRFKAGRIGFVPGYDGPDGEAKRTAALELPTGAGWRALADMLRELSGLGLHVPTATRHAAEALRQIADAEATQREGEEKQRREIADARRRVRESLATFNRERRAYARYLAALDTDSAPGLPRTIARTLDSILSRVPDAKPWGTERGFELRPDLAERAARIATAAEAWAAPLATIRDDMRTEAERREAAARAAERAERERVAAMTADERRAAWEAGEIDRQHVRDVETVSGPLLRAVAPEIDGCRVMGGTLETSQGATVPLRHAFRVFQFIALCRAERKAWTPGAWGPRHIRVGHFSVDSVAVSGDFRAGCHSIQWAEVSRLAERLGVAGCLASLPELAAELAGEAA